MSIQRPQLLVFYQLLHELLKADKIWNSINSALYNLDVPNLEEVHEELQVRMYVCMYLFIYLRLLVFTNVCVQQLCQCRLSLTCELLMNGFIESNALYSAQRLSVATYASYRAAHYNTGATSSCMYAAYTPYIYR